MSDRAIPADGAPACPFVAFDDDRDARSTAPDHRHRCFAEPVPAPRAIAHQDAYCLSPAFAVCPAFQDWARREAAVARQAPAAAPAPRPREEDTSRPVPLPPVDREPRHAPAGAAQPVAGRKPPPRDWAAPPPWAADSEAGGEGPSTPGPVQDAGIGWAAAAGVVAGAAAVDATRSGGHDEWGAESRGLADSPAARLAGPDLDLPAPARPVTSWAPSPGKPGDAAADAAAPVIATVPPSRPQSAVPYAPVSSPDPLKHVGAAPPARAASSRSGAKAAPPHEAQELFGPAWERPQRYEAYPSLRTRVGLPSVGLPPIAMGVVAVVIAALVLFFIAPMLLGIGKSSPGSSAAPPSSGASAAPSASSGPTIGPAPTAIVYTVVRGDTLSKIAAKYGVTVPAILAANPSIKNPNSINVGDQIIIPAKGSGSSGGAVGGASPSAVAGASASH